MADKGVLDYVHESALMPGEKSPQASPSGFTVIRRKYEKREEIKLYSPLPIKVAELSLTTMALSDMVLKLQTQVKDLMGKLASHSIIVPIASFAPEPYEVLKPFSVVVKPVDNEYVATFFDANLSMTGDTEVEAVDNLKDIILTVFDKLQTETSDNLGVEPKRQLDILRSLIRKAS
jgi:predicted RNase H-like HicB family nuclease